MSSLGQARSRCLTLVKLGEMSPGQKHLDGNRVFQLDVLWDLSSQGGGEKLVGSWRKACGELEQSLWGGGEKLVGRWRKACGEVALVASITCHSAVQGSVGQW